MSSGVEVSDSVVVAFKSLVKDRKYRGAILRIAADLSQIEVEDTFEPSASTADAKADWGKLVKKLPDSDCRYIIYDFPYEHQGTIKNKVLLVTWTPELTKVRSKMVYASSKDGLSKKLEGVQRTLQCTDDEEIGYPAVSKILRQGTAGY